ncbi:MAG: hypothetical protein WCL53_05160 [Chloroflexota bacterium]
MFVALYESHGRSSADSEVVTLLWEALSNNALVRVQAAEWGSGM